MSASAALVSRLSEPLRSGLRQRLVTLLSRKGPAIIDYDRPPGDPGLFGPDSVTWKIHADFPGMMTGGICALMLQTLHPLALAGVWDHSSFRTDILGRLRRTTAFVAGTSYASTADAQRQIERVRAIHRRIVGTAQDGRPYAASDPALLTWVHVTESWSFLNGYRRFCYAGVPAAAQDRYYDEVRRVAVALGATRVPRRVAQVDRYFERIRPQLVFDQRSRDVLAVLAGMELPVPGSALFRDAFLLAGSSLLPVWARQMMGLPARLTLRERLAVRSVRAAAPSLRAALSGGVAARACRRVGADPAMLGRWPAEPVKARSGRHRKLVIT